MSSASSASSVSALLFCWNVLFFNGQLVNSRKDATDDITEVNWSWFLGGALLHVLAAGQLDDDMLPAPLVALALPHYLSFDRALVSASSFRALFLIQTSAECSHQPTEGQRFFRATMSLNAYCTSLGTASISIRETDALFATFERQRQGPQGTRGRGEKKGNKGESSVFLEEFGECVMRAAVKEFTCKHIM